ncbi:MAG: hypothetical protein H6767_10065 [Candidatus Peribacteria bacterium]|nr:MAG: hypothetical protein H6767_10065 [Candidatus Peribacteria bacterium]
MSQSRIKSLFFCIVFLVLSGGQYEAMAFVGEDLGLDLYESIDEGIIELDRKNYEYELKNGIIEGSTVATTVNYILGVNGHEPCISPNL